MSHAGATRSHLRHVLSENPVTLVAAGLFALFVLLALAGPWLAPHDPLASNAAVALQPPSAAHWFGTAALGRDILSRVIVATRLDLGIAVSAVLVSFVVGMPLGLAAGYFGGWWDRIVTRVSGTVMAFPLFVQAMGIVAAHLFPNALPPAMVQVSLNMGWAILNAAGLSFIGLGVRPPQPQWGILVAEGAQFIVSGEWWVSLFPGLALMLAVFTFNLLGDALRDIFDPRRRT